MNKDIGQDLYFLEPVSHIKDISEQIIEIDRRLNILWNKRQTEHDPPLPIAPAHIVATLGLQDKDQLNEWVKCDVKLKINLDKENGYKDRGDTIQSVRLAADTALTDIERIELIKQRSGMLALWLAKCETTYLDTSANPLYKGGQQGSIKGLEMCYGYKTTEQLEVVSKGDDLSIGLEAFRKRQAAKAAKTG